MRVTNRARMRGPDTLDAGDFVRIRPNGWQWSNEERRAPYWLIVKCPTIPYTEARLSEEGGDPVPEGFTQQARKRFMDTTKLPARLRTVLQQLAGEAEAGAKYRARAVESVTITPAEWRAARTERAV